MLRLIVTLVCSAFLLSACGTGKAPEEELTTIVRPSNSPDFVVYRITKRDESNVLFRMLDSVNAYRQAAGAHPVILNVELSSAAATHSRDMALQNRPWHFGSDGSSPIERVWRAGYRRTLLGEAISESFETELETLVAWMADRETRDVVVNPQAEHMGFAWYQEPGGKLWWTLVMGGGSEQSQPAPNPTVLHQG